MVISYVSGSIYRTLLATLLVQSIFSETAGLDINGLEDCLEIVEPTVCYHCDSANDTSCGDPFKYSHYYGTKDVYLAECLGCCVKVMQMVNGKTQRIRRSCSENLPPMNLTYMNCNNNAPVGNETGICLCHSATYGLCNKGSQISTCFLIMLPFAMAYRLLQGLLV